MIDWDRFAKQSLQTRPYQWAFLDRLYAPDDAVALAATFPNDHFKHLSDYGGEKDFEYESRELIGMGSSSVSRPSRLSPAWRAIASDLLSQRYRTAMSALIGVDLAEAALEVNVFHYPPGGSLGPHPDLGDKIVTHVLYFNSSWNEADGGCLTILGSSDVADVAFTVPPVVGNSAIIVRSASSWHAVTPVVRSCRSSRRSLTATFYHPGSISTMWPPGDNPQLHQYPPSRWARLWSSFRS
jgi:SM-20-related protein